jgi:hypothetical protein
MEKIDENNGRIANDYEPEIGDHLMVRRSDDTWRKFLSKYLIS